MNETIPPFPNENVHLLIMAVIRFKLFILKLFKHFEKQLITICGAEQIFILRITRFRLIAGF